MQQNIQFGQKLLEDLRYYLSEKRIETIIDVGANEGQSLDLFVRHFPAASVFCFEPGKEALEVLRRKVQQYPTAYLEEMALSDRSGETRFFCSKHSALNSLLQEDKDYCWDNARLEETVSVRNVTLDEWREEKRIECIDILKLDVQGAEALVLKGAEKTLNEKRIRGIKTEVLYQKLYKNQTSLEELMTLLKSHSFQFIGLYENFYDGVGRLQWGDALFIHDSEFDRFGRSVLP